MIHIQQRDKYIGAGAEGRITATREGANYDGLTLLVGQVDSRDKVPIARGHDEHVSIELVNRLCDVDRHRGIDVFGGVGAWHKPHCESCLVVSTGELFRRYAVFHREIYGNADELPEGTGRLYN